MIENKWYNKLYFRLLGHWSRSVVDERISQSIAKEAQSRRRINQVIAEGGGINDIIAIL
jgi:hypothetical protein